MLGDRLELCLSIVKKYKRTCLLCLSITMILRDTNAIIFANDVVGWSVRWWGGPVGGGWRVKIKHRNTPK